MGCTAAKDGISVQFYDDRGEPDGTPLYGRFATMFGSLRRDVTKDNPTDQEKQFPGSDDWLTVIGVADTKAKLDKIVSDWQGGSPPQTSCSSHRVSIDLRIGGVQQVFRDRTTIASGPIISLIKDKIKIDVVHVKVLSAGASLTDLAADHPLVTEFQGGAIALNNI
jgi:hypothetical protein